MIDFENLDFVDVSRLVFNIESEAKAAPEVADLVRQIAQQKRAELHARLSELIPELEKQHAEAQAAVPPAIQKYDTIAGEVNAILKKQQNAHLERDIFALATELKAAQKRRADAELDKNLAVGAARKIGNKFSAARRIISTLEAQWQPAPELM